MMETRIATGRQPLVHNLDDYRHGTEAGPFKTEVAETPYHRINLWTVLEGQSIPVHRHADAECIMIVMAGEGEYTQGGHRCQLTKENMITVPPDTAHGIRNTNNAPLVVLTIEGPGRFDA